ncbi:rhotekin isoform X1 [Crotalus tigris]|uniref:rhotekin isoform X1 n=1 Tax=Crotalus tigris TaxID=88082 RepID=UPI00192FACEC|nr:rhotekin isoform X1 [Crotalus tigris]XP_039189783.1 rhotekin isoform X1 [Crotalus tigris]
MQDRLHILEDLNMLYIRQIALSLEGTDLQKKIDHEVRMRDGACKLLAACTQRPQALEVTKSLLVCNSRILAYMAELQRMKEAQVMQHMARRPSEAGPTDSRLPCRGRICVSDLRIPLMWKDTEYFKNKGDLHRCAVFCLLQIGTEIYDTEMVLADRTLADLCFENAVLFTEAGPDFELKIELYSAALEGDSALGATPKKLASRLSSSLGRSSGKQMRAALDGSAPGSNGGCSPLMLPLAASTTGPKYQLLACAHLGLAHVQDAFRTHDLLVTGNEECSFWLPLYGSLCCRLVAQPSCMVEQVMAGFLKVQQGEQLDWTRLFCVLRGTNLLCYRRPQDAEAQAEAAFTIAINKETRIRASEKSPRGPVRCMSVTNHYGGEEVTHMLQAESPAEAQRWMEVFWQHFYDMSQWKHCCDEVMTVEMPSPRHPPLLLPKQGSLYHEMAIEPADDIEAVTEILARRVSDLGEPVWLSLFEGSSPGIASNSSHGCSSTGPCPPQPPWGRPRTFSLDAKLSRLKGRAGRPPPSPLPKAPGPSCSSSGSSSSCSSSPDSERTLQTPNRPWFDPRLWLQSQV